MNWAWLWTKWSGWAIGIERRGVFQARYAFGKVSSVSMLGARPVNMGTDIITTGAICRDIDVAMFPVLVN